MRKLFWVFAGIMMLAALGNIIGGTDTPATASVTPGTQAVRVGVPEAPRFDATLYVAASSLNLREAPSTNGRVLASLKHDTKVMAGERRSGWGLVSANGQVGWVSAQSLSGTPAARAAPAISVPARNQPGYGVVQRQSEASCPSRRYCTQIDSCEEARWYLANCSWGHRLDGDNDGVPCEALCR
ncbi:SH3 domain-containing protein [Devosia sp.]|uniref:SH3 domain-containing protein n=1 Tax=Devosia sp. TaxID=1871048 RepID=UPI002B003E3C|nr:SH3 domain-containing protein [Devosia sp.]